MTLSKVQHFQLQIPIQQEKFLPITPQIKGTSPKIGISVLSSKINLLFWTALGCWTTYNLIDSGLSRVLALETLTHGTGPLGFYLINSNGADPSLGGGDPDIAPLVDALKITHTPKDYFPVFEDTRFKRPFYLDRHPDSSDMMNTIEKVLIARTWAILSGVANFSNLGLTQSAKPLDIFQGIVGGVLGFLTPTLKFRFTPQEILESNESSPQPFRLHPGLKLGYLTSKRIEASRLGITGSLLHGINLEMFSRMAANPQKVVTGILLLGAAAIVAQITFRNLVESLKTSSENDLTENITHSQSLRGRITRLASGTAWTAVALGAIFFNTM